MSTQEWRLMAQVDGSKAAGELLRRLGSGGELLGASVGGRLPVGVTVTRQGDTVFAYASSQATVTAVRSIVADVLRSVGRDAAMQISRWDEDVADWRQVDPPLTGAAHERDTARADAATRPTTRTVTLTTVGEAERALLEGVAADAARFSVNCTMAAEPLRLRTRLAFTISGPTAKVDAFIVRLKTELSRMRPKADAPLGP